MSDPNSKSPEELSALIAETQAKQTIKPKTVIPQINELGASIGARRAAKPSTIKAAKTYVDPENPENV